MLKGFSKYDYSLQTQNEYLPNVGDFGYSVHNLLKSNEKNDNEDITEITQLELLQIRHELKRFANVAENIYFKYFQKLKDNDVDVDNGGAFCTKADKMIEECFKDFVKSSKILCKYTIIGEETGITEGDIGNGKNIFIDPIDCTHWFKDGEKGSGTIIGVYDGGKNIAGLTLDISNHLSYFHSGDEFEILDKDEVIKSKKRIGNDGNGGIEYKEYEDKKNEWIQKGKCNNELYIYNSCKGEHWYEGDTEHMLEVFTNEYPDCLIKERSHRSVTSLNSALGFNQGFIHYGTSAHDFSHMIGFTQACGGVIMDHNGKVITEMDVKQVLKNYSYAEKLKEESKILKKQSDVIKKILKQIEVFETNVNIENTTDFLDKIFDSYSKSLFKVGFFKEVITALSMFLRGEETDDKSYKQEMNILNEKGKKLSSQSIELEQRYRSYIYTFPIIVASDYVTAKEYAKLLGENFGDRLNKMQTEVLPIEERLRRNVNVLSNAISKGMF